MSAFNAYTACASLAALGRQCHHLQLWPIIAQHVHIKQKVRRHQPLEKLQDSFVNILAGGHGLVEINTRLRADPALQRAFGRSACAEQSTISDTLNACTPATVDQMRAALVCLLRQHSQTARHDYQRHWQLLDIDMTGLCAGRLGEGVTKGYFTQRKHARGRQLGRVLASHYDELVTERLFVGKRQLETSLLELVDAAEQALDLQANQRQNTLLRIDAGGGSTKNITALLARDYQLLIKLHNWQRACKLAATVTHWWPDPQSPEREIGWVTAPHDYGRCTQQVALRRRKANGQWAYTVLVSTLSDALLGALTAQPRPRSRQQRALLILHGYDLRGGGVETQNKSDKQGLGLAKRNKQRFAAQEMLVLLAQLAHNLVIWTRNALARSAPRLAGYGIQRMIRDVLRIPGCVRFEARGQVLITLSDAHPLARDVASGFQNWLTRDDLSVILGKI